MKTVSIHDAKTNLSKYIAAAKRGEQIAIGAYGKQEVWLTTRPAKVRPKQTKPLRKLGSLEHELKTGKIYIAPDAFSEELDREISDSFEANQDVA